MNFKSGFLQELESRGFIAQITHSQELDDLMASEKITAYIGFDCTAKSLHVGSLIQIMILRLLQKHGHTPIALLGGGTTKIGDPSGKDEARQILTEEKIQQNLDGIKNTLAQFISFDVNGGKASARLVNNDDWLKNLNYIEFLRDVGKHFSVNRMLTFDSVKARLERDQPFSFLEFNYMILQAYDFYELNNKHNCRLQIGGSDQWGNIVNGVELTRRISSAEIVKHSNLLFSNLKKENPNNQTLQEITENQTEYFNFMSSDPSQKELQKYRDKSAIRDSQISGDTTVDISDKSRDIMERLDKIIMNYSIVFGLTSPLLTTADGKKMGKTADGAVWLSSKMLAPFDYFQYFRNTHDADVGKFLKLFTDLSLEKIAELENLKDQEINKAKEILAFEVTKICHGEKTAQEVLQKAREIFISKNSTAYETKEIAIGEGKKLTEIIKEIGAVESNAEAKRLIEGRGVKINDQAVADTNHIISEAGEFNLAVGKKKFFRIIVR